MAEVWKQEALHHMSLAVRDGYRLPQGVHTAEQILEHARKAQVNGKAIVPQSVWYQEKPDSVWHDLFGFIVANWDKWDKQRAMHRLQRWEADSCSQNCRSSQWSKWKLEEEPVVSTAAGMFEWASRARNYIATTFAKKPEINLDECYSLYFPAEDCRPSLPIVTALSLIPQHVARQTVCLDSWKRFGFQVWAMNTSAEIEKLRVMYPQIDRWIVEDRVSTDYGYPTQLIRNMAMASVKNDTAILIVNSDIEIYGRSDSLESYLGDIENEQVHFIRWNYDSDRRDCSEFQWGIDAVTFTPEQALGLPGDFPYAIGQAMWDYATPYYALIGGYRVRFAHERLFYHQDHPQNWKQAAWQFGSDWISSRTELRVSEPAASALWRESLDPHCYYQKKYWLTKSESKSPSRTSFSIDYDAWKAASRGARFL